MEESAIAALVRVVSVTCVSVGKDPHTGDPQPSYSAKLELLDVKKGREKPGDSVTVNFTETPKGIVGPWTVFYYPGEEVWTYLKGTPGSYETTWWNARSQPIKNAEITALPMTPGETVSIEAKP